MRLIVVLFLLLLFGISPSIYAQSVNKSTETKKNSKWEIGMDFLPIIDNFKTSPKIDSAPARFKSYIIFKYRISEHKKLRSRLGFRYYEAKRRPNAFSDKFLLSGGPLGFYGSLGFEHYLRKGRAALFLGSEISGSFFRIWERDDTRDLPPGGPFISRTIRQYYSDQYYWLSGIIGIQYHFSDRLAFSFEMSPSIGYQKEYTDSKEYRDGDLYFDGGDTRKVFHADLRPLSAIHLTYQF